MTCSERSTTARDPLASVCHRDGTATVWSVYTQGWVRLDREAVRRGAWDRVLASIGADERVRILRHLERSAGRRVARVRGEWLSMPASYDPRGVTAEDVRQDSQIIVLE